MIDRTSSRIEQQETALRRHNRRRYAFQRMLEALRDCGQVQDTLDSLFEIQERLFRWRYPDWQDIEPDGDGTADFDYAS